MWGPLETIKDNTNLKTGSARVFGYTVYMGFLNRVYGVFWLKYEYTTNFGYTVYNAWINFGYIGRNLGYFVVFWRIFFGYILVYYFIPSRPCEDAYLNCNSLLAVYNLERSL